jgi:hypothetical protein
MDVGGFRYATVKLRGIPLCYAALTAMVSFDLAESIANGPADAGPGTDFSGPRAFFGLYRRC